MKVLFIAVFFAALAAGVRADDQFSTARDLYTSAAYEEALALLTNLHNDKADQYRAFCLFALGRTSEATSVAEHLIAADPLLELESDASPRIAAMFTDARRRLLPALARDQYRSARAAMEMPLIVSPPEMKIAARTSTTVKLVMIDRAAVCMMLRFTTCSNERR